MILIVDDNQANIFSLKTLLTINDFEVDTAASGDEALKKILKNTYSLVILDVQMPEMDGFEVAEAISGYSKSRDIPIIFLSAINTHKKFITKGYNSGGIDYVVKPFDPDILLLKVKTFYRLSEQTRRLNAMEKSLREEIDHKNKAEVLLQENVDELQSILESIPLVAFTINPDGSVEYVNQHWYSFSGDKNTFPQTDGLSVQACVGTAIKSLKTVSMEVRIRNLASGEFLFHILCLTPIIKDYKIIKWVGVFTDIHEQKMASRLLEKRVNERTEQLKVTNERLEETNKDLQQFAFIASHDLQEPLRKIQTFSDIVLNNHVAEDDKAKTFLTKISLSADRLRKLVTGLLDYSRIGQDVQFVRTDLNAIVREALTDVELKVDAIDPVITIQKLFEIDCIPLQMRQLFQNLISNALKFTRDGVRCEIKVGGEIVGDKSLNAPLSSSGAFCRIWISDNGIGFKQEYKNKIFEIFQRLNPRELYEGTGIGLSIVKKVIDRHHGLIDVESRENEGTTFIMVLPVQQSAPFPKTAAHQNETL